jgi:hypothetical protein
MHRRSFFRRLVATTTLAVATASAVAGCGTSSNLGAGTVVLPMRPSLYLRVTPDADASALVGAFLPDEVGEGDVDEAQAMRTRCSRFITPRRIPASGEFRELTSASSSAAGKVGVKSIARIDLGGSQSQALLVTYALHEKMQSEVDEDGLAQCCAAAPDQCTRRYISGAVMADGSYFAATAHAASNGVDAATVLQKVNIDASVLYQDDLKWERQAAFKRQYFAFSLQRTLSTSGVAARPAVADDCRWANEVPTSLDGNYFVGVSNPMTTEKVAREDAMRDARDQVVRYLGEFLSETSATAQATKGKAEDLTVLINDDKTKASIAQGVARFVKDQRWCGPKEEATPSGVKNTMKVLAFFPNAEKKAAALAALRSMVEVRKAQGGATAALEAMLRDVEAQP